MNPEQFFYQGLSESGNDKIVSELENLGAIVKKERNLENGYVATFKFGEAITTIGFKLNDKETGADLVIETIATLPDDQKGKGFGRQAVQTILRWAKANNFKNIKTVQAQDRNAGFWEKNGFKKDPEPNPIGLFSYWGG